MTEMGCQSHTTRALMSAGGSLAKKHCLTVVFTAGENGDRICSINAWRNRARFFQPPDSTPAAFFFVTGISGSSPLN
jgi:hypothetical protein